MQIYIGNLSTETTDDDLRAMFEPYGKVTAAAVGRDKKTGESQGYGIVEMPVKSEVRAAVDALRGKEMDGKPLRVRALKPDDPFHGTVIGKGQGAKGGSGPQFRGDSAHRGTGAIRRGGQRGS